MNTRKKEFHHIIARFTLNIVSTFVTFDVYLLYQLYIDFVALLADPTATLYDRLLASLCRPFVCLSIF